MSERPRFRPQVQPLALTELELAPTSQTVRTAPLLRGDLIESLLMIAVVMTLIGYKTTEAPRLAFGRPRP